MNAEGVRILVVYDSRRGAVERLAHAVGEGARALAGAEVRVLRVGEVSPEELLACDGLALGSPVHTGTMSAGMKQFLDDLQLRHGWYPHRPLADRVGAAFSAGGQEAGGRELTQLSLLAALLHHGLFLVAGGGAFGASAATETGDVPLDERDLANARALGRRLAEAARIVRLGRLAAGHISTRSSP